MKLRPFLNRAKRGFKLIFNRLKHISKQRILVLGDSHVDVFNHINKNYKLPYYFEVGYVSGATSLGVANPNSKTNALKIFRTKLRRTSKSTPVIVQLGEVDCGFVIFFTAQKKEVPVQDQFNKSLLNYTNFIQQELIDQGFKKIIIMSATLPTLADNNPELGTIANLRKEVRASQKERTELTLSYNKHMKEFCSSKDEVVYMDLDPILLNPKTGLIDDSFKNSDALDHHNDHGAYSKPIVEELMKLSI